MTEGAARRRSYSAGRFFLIAVAFVAAAPLFWQRVEINPGDVAASRENADLYQYVYPVYDYGFDRLRKGELPLWNPRQLCGTPFLADSRVGLFQPLNALFLLMPTERALAVHGFASLALMGLFFTLFARSLGLGYTPAVLGGLAYAFSGASAAAMSRPALAATLAWSPLLFWAVGDYCRRGRLAGAVVAGLTLGAMILSGALGLMAALAPLLIAYAAVTLAGLEEVAVREKVKRSAVLSAAPLLALAVSAVQWVPTVVWLIAGGTLNGDLWNFHASAQTPHDLRELLLQVPMARPGTLPRLAYVGIPTLLLVPAAFAHKPFQRHVAVFGAVAVLGFAALLINPAALPGSFPPQALAYPAAFATAALTAIGADRLFMRRREGATPGPWPAAGIVLAAAVLLFMLFPGEVRVYVIAFVAVLLPFLAIRRGWAAALSGLLMALLLFFDLLSASANAYMHPFQDAPRCYAHYAPGIQTAAEQALGGRTLVSAAPVNVKLPANLGMIAGLNMVGAYELPQTPAQRAWFQRALPGASGDEKAPAAALSLLNFASMRVLMAAPDAPLPAMEGSGLQLRPLPSQGDLQLSVNENALPRAYWVPRCRTADGLQQALDLLADPAFDRDRECVVDTAAADPGAANTLPVADTASAGTGPTWRDASCAVEDVSPERVTVTVKASAAGITILTDTMAPGWEATLDGVPCRVLQVNGLFRGIATPAGMHTIAFHYRALDFELASALSLATLALIAALGAVGLYRGTERRP